MRFPAHPLVLLGVFALAACPTKSQHTYTDSRIAAMAATIDSFAAGARHSKGWIMPVQPGMAPDDTGSAFVDERRFMLAARCNSAMPGTVRGMLVGRFDEAGQVPVDTPLAGVIVQLIVTPIDSIRGKYFDRLATAGQGQYFFFGVPTTGHYELEAWNVVIRDFPYTISAGFIQDLGERCVLPSRDGRIPLSRRHQRVLIDKGLL